MNAPSSEKSNPLRLLFIDPDEASVRRLTEAMTERGWQVQSASSFAKARDLMTATPFDLVVIELVLPDALATDVWQFIRKLYPNIPGFVTTSSRSLYNSVNPSAPGIIAYLFKPEGWRVVYEFAARREQERQLTEENRAMEKRLANLSDFTSNISFSRSVEEAAEAVVEFAPTTVRADWTIIDILDVDERVWSLQKSGGTIPPPSGTDLFEFLEKIKLESAATSRPVIISGDQLLYDSYGIFHIDQVQLTAVMAVPILAESHLLGTITLLTQKPFNGFSPLDVQMIVLTSQALGLTLLKMRQAQQAFESLNQEEKII